MDGPFGREGFKVAGSGQALKNRHEMGRYQRQVSAPPPTARIIISKKLGLNPGHTSRSTDVQTDVFPDRFKPEHTE